LFILLLPLIVLFSLLSLLSSPINLSQGIRVGFPIASSLPVLFTMSQ
jgi:hypothetical protein